MINLHTLNYLTETIYSMNVLNDEDDINYEINTFFGKLMRRRRNDDVEEGLQAGGVIYPDRAGFKISERDGRASHARNIHTVVVSDNAAINTLKRFERISGKRNIIKRFLA